MARKALIVGIDQYTSNPLTASVADANRLEAILRVNGNGGPNFSTQLVTSTNTTVDKATLRGKIEQLFQGDSEIALFYFSGHGYITATGGMIVTQDARRFDEGISMDDIVVLANASEARNKIIILDCCYSGAAGSPAITGGSSAVIGKGITIMTASRENQLAEEVENDGGVFTTLVIEGLQGGAADIRGRITPSSLYAYVDEALGDWQQRPVFKTNIHEFVQLRSVQPLVPPEVLRKLPEYFSDPTTEFPLDPDYEPDSPTPDSDKNVIFKELQTLNRATLLVPVGVDHMYDAAMQSTACKLTAFGAQYWRMAKQGRL